MTKAKNASLNSEKQLLEYIDIPYFQNNPSYIEKWRNYYQKNPDMHILLLMYHKKISTLYHWIYIEFSKHFVKMGKYEIAHYILSEAIHNKVYQKERLQEALASIPDFQKQYLKGDLACILNQKNIKALGKIWNKYEEAFYSNLFLKNPSVNFRMMMDLEYFKLLNYKIQNYNSDGYFIECSEDVFSGTFYIQESVLELLEKHKIDTCSSIQTDITCRWICYLY